jgi:hypothetical protein
MTMIELEEARKEVETIYSNYQEYFKSKGMDVSSNIIWDLVRAYLANNTDFLDNTKLYRYKGLGI